jgi:hypothetical protein
MSSRKKKSATRKGLIKGTPTAVLVSTGIHLALLLVAGGFVVFSIIDRQEQKFVPPQRIERPKMRLKKLRVKVKQNTKPRRTVQRIATKTTKAMPDIQLPEMTSAGSSLAQGIGGFELMDDLSGMSLLGGGRSIGNDLVGTYYYLMHKRDGTPYPGMSGEAGANVFGRGLCPQVISEFLEKGWDTSVFDPFWRSSKKLYATQIFIPPVSSSLAPEKFGDTSRNEAAYWLAHYKGEIAYPKGGRFRFWGFGDDVLFVRINGKIVLDACWEGHYEANMSGWRSSDPDNRRYTLANSHFRIGDWFELKPGEPVPMEVLIGEIPGGGFSAMLCIQQEGVDYPEREVGGPFLPVFKTAETPEHLIDEMGYTLPEGQVDLTGGPIFGVY